MYVAGNSVQAEGVGVLREARARDRRRAAYAPRAARPWASWPQPSAAVGLTPRWARSWAAARPRWRRPPWGLAWPLGTASGRPWSGAPVGTAVGGHAVGLSSVVGTAVGLSSVGPRVELGSGHSVVGTAVVGTTVVGTAVGARGPVVGAAAAVARRRRGGLVVVGAQVVGAAAARQHSDYGERPASKRHSSRF